MLSPGVAPAASVSGSAGLRSYLLMPGTVLASQKFLQQLLN